MKNTFISFAYKHDRWIVIFLALATCLIWHKFNPIIFTCDSVGYVQSSKALVGLEPAYHYFRTPLIPFLMALTGVPTHETLQGFILLQLWAGIMMIIIMHESFRRISVSIGLIFSLILISTFIAFVQSKAIMTEQFYLLGWCLCIDGTLAFFKQFSKIRLLQIFTSLVILTLARPQGTYIALFLIPMLAIKYPKKIPSILIASLLSYSLIFGYKYFMPPMRHISTDKKTEEISKLTISHSTSKFLLMAIYNDTAQYFKKPIIQSKNGPASEKLFQLLKKHFSNSSNFSHYALSNNVGPYANNIDALIKNMELAPNREYWWYIWLTMDNELNFVQAEKLLSKVIFEAFKAHPLEILTVYARNFVISFLHNDKLYVWKHPIVAAPVIGSGLIFKEIQDSGDFENHSTFAVLLNAYFHSTKVVLATLILLTLPFIRRREFRYSWFFCLLMILYNQATVSLAADPLSRYIYYIFPVMLVMMAYEVDYLYERGILKLRKLIPQALF